MEKNNKLLDYYKAGEYDNAEKLANSIIKKNPDDQLGWKVLGALLSIKGKKEEALKANQKSIKLSPNDHIAHNNLGNTLRELGKFKEAETSYRKAIAIKHNYAEAYSNLGNVLQDLDRLDESELSHKKAISLKSDFTEAYINLAHTLNRLSKFDEAEIFCRKALELRPDIPEAHNNLGNTLRELGRFTESETRYRKAIAIRPNYAEAHYNLGRTLEKLNKIDDAKLFYKKAISIKPDFVDPYNQLGNLFLKIGIPQEAKVNYKKAIEIKSDFLDGYWNLQGAENNIHDAEYWVEKSLRVNKNYENAKLMKAALRFYQGDKTEYKKLIKEKFHQHPHMRSFSWVFNLPKLPNLYFNQWHFFDDMIKDSILSRPFYEFGVWRGDAFKYLIKSFKKGYGFDTFTGLPEDWKSGTHIEKAGTYSNYGVVPNIKGGEFIVGKFEDTLPIFFSKKRTMASLINFDADLYSSTICALNNSKSIIDKHTILIFDEFIMNETWEEDEFKALNEFASINKFKYDVVAISFFTKQVAVKLINI